MTFIDVEAIVACDGLFDGFCLAGLVERADGRTDGRTQMETTLRKWRVAAWTEWRSVVEPPALNHNQLPYLPFFLLYHIDTLICLVE